MSEEAESRDGGFQASRLSAAELAWGVASPPRSYWPVRLAILAAIGLYLLLPDAVIVGPRYLVPALEAAALVTLSVATPHRTTEQSGLRRVLSTALIALVTVANLFNLGLLVHGLLGGSRASGRQLILAAIAVWVTNVIVFALWYWELDRGGPLARHDAGHREPDFLFPQMASPGAGRPAWAPAFVDYLYVSLTNAAAFSPTDTMPLTAAAKILMGVQSLGSLLTVAMVAARAVNILH